MDPLLSSEPLFRHVYVFGMWGLNFLKIVEGTFFPLNVLEALPFSINWKNEKRNKSRLSSLLFRCIQLETKVKAKKGGIVIPEELFKEMVGTYIKMEQILATLETLADEETLKAIEESKKLF